MRCQSKRSCRQVRRQSCIALGTLTRLVKSFWNLTLLRKKRRQRNRQIKTRQLNVLWWITILLPEKIWLSKREEILYLLNSKSLKTLILLFLLQKSAQIFSRHHTLKKTSFLRSLLRIRISKELALATLLTMRISLLARTKRWQLQSVYCKRQTSRIDRKSE